MIEQATYITCTQKILLTYQSISNHHFHVNRVQIVKKIKHEHCKLQNVHFHPMIFVICHSVKVKNYSENFNLHGALLIDKFIGHRGFTSQC